MCCEHVLCLYWSLYSFVIVFVIIQTIVIMYAHINKKYTVHMILMYSTNYRYYSNSGFDHVCIFQFFPLLFLLLKVFNTGSVYESGCQGHEWTLWVWSVSQHTINVAYDDDISCLHNVTMHIKCLRNSHTSLKLLDHHHNAKRRDDRLSLWLTSPVVIIDEDWSARPNSSRQRHMDTRGGHLRHLQSHIATSLQLSTSNISSATPDKHYCCLGRHLGDTCLQPARNQRQARAPLHPTYGPWMPRYQTPHQSYSAINNNTQPTSHPYTSTHPYQYHRSLTYTHITYTQTPHIWMAHYTLYTKWMIHHTHTYEWPTHTAPIWIKHLNETHKPWM